MEEPKVAEDDKAAAARARRQRILENSNKRLSKLTGREHNEEIPKVEPVTTKSNGEIYDDPEYERDIFESAPLGASTLLSPNMMMNDPANLFQMFQGQGGLFDPSMMMGGQSTNVNATPPVPQSSFQKLIKSKLPIVLFALVTYSLFAFKLDHIIGGSVFGALIAWEIFEFGYTTFIAPENEPAGIINVVFAFIGVTAEKGRIILKVLGLANKIIRDIAIFMFTFVATHILWSSFILDEPFSYIFDKDFDKFLQQREYIK